MPWLQTRLWRPLWLLVALLTPAAVVHSALDGKLAPAVVGVSMAAAVALVAALAWWLGGNGLGLRLVRALLDGASRWPVAGWIVLGLVLRAVAVALMMVPPASDGEVYLGLAVRLWEGQPYVDPRGDLAYWPPGYPFFLVPMVALFGHPNPWLIPVFNLVLFVVAAGLLAAFVRALGRPGAAPLAVAVLACWPNLVMSTVLASKEPLVMTVLLGAGLLFVRAGQVSAGSASGGLLRALGAGVLMGLASLVQPSLMLFPSVLLLYVLADRRLWPRAPLVLAVVLAMAAVIAPWTLRNARVLGQVVPISTNGGDVFYRANNERADGGYAAEGAVDLRQWDELERSRRGYALGRAWIESHPGDFARLALVKLALFQGDESFAAYWGLKRAFGVDGLPYAVAKAVSVLPWVVFWAALLMVLLRARGLALPREAALLQIGYFYLLSMHAVFESDSRHHTPYFGWLLVLGTVMLAAWVEATRAPATDDGPRR